MIDAIFTDLDGVIRHWDNQRVHAVEIQYQLPQGFLFQYAFAKELLFPTITGQQTHNEWTQKIAEAIEADVEPDIAQHLLDTWHEARYSIDLSVIDAYRAIAPTAKLILVTNATDRLNDDLRNAQIADLFDVIINSSEIGLAKPDMRFYQATLSLTGVQPHETLYVDDSTANVQSAQALGFRTVHFRERGQAFSELRRLTSHDSS